jgi:serine/threonine protein kinase
MDPDLDCGAFGAAEELLHRALDLPEGERAGRLEEWCAADRALPDADLLRLTLDFCDAVESVHRNLLLHRDLKPGDILVRAGDRPRLLDFGNAGLLGAEASGGLTKLGYRAFTPEFASPEQVLRGAVTAASGVYSVGVLLDRLLSGRAPPTSPSTSSRPTRNLAVSRATRPMRASPTATPPRPPCAKRSTSPRSSPRPKRS